MRIKKSYWTQEREDGVTPHLWMQRKQSMITVLTHTPGQTGKRGLVLVGEDVK